jgi:uncharacterized beta barrel domain-containing protein DUF5777
MISTRTSVVFAAFLLAAGVAPVRAQEPAAAAAQPEPADRPARNDRAVDPSQPDFTLITLPTTLRMPRFGSSFRVTHRFTRPLGQGDFGDLLSDGLATDGGAQIGLEYRFGLMSGTQGGVYRTSDKTIAFFVQQHIIQQGNGRPVGIDALASVDGTNNFHDSYSPGIGAVISRTLGRHGAVYAQPIWINNTNPLPSELVDDNSTFVLGFGGRFRIRPTVYIVAEAAPRVGYRPDTTHASFAIEKRAGGHSFQLNFSNGVGSTLSQVARGGATDDRWYFGFNISRKFF